MYSLKDKRWHQATIERKLVLTDNEGNRAVYEAAEDYTDIYDIVAEHLYNVFEDSTSETEGREGIGDYEWDCKEWDNHITWRITDGESYLVIKLYLEDLADDIDTSDIKSIMADVLNYPESYLRD